MAEVRRVRILLLCFIALHSMMEMAAQTDILVLRKGKKTKHLKFSDTDIYDIRFDATGDSVQWDRIEFTGTLDGYFDNNIYVEPRREKSIWSSGCERRNYEAVFDVGESAILIPTSNIEWIKRQSESAEGLFNTAGAFSVLTSFSALILAPLASIKYENGGFNEDRYLKWAGISASLSGFFGGIMALNKKKYRLKPVKNKTDVWEIKTK